MYVLDADDGDRLRLEVEVDADEMLDEGGDIICHAGSEGLGRCVVRGAVGSVGESRTSADWSWRKWCCCCVWMGCGIRERESDLARDCPCSGRAPLVMFRGAGFVVLSKTALGSRV